MKVEYVVTVEVDTVEEADIVMAERLGYEESYGFAYSVEYKYLTLQQDVL